MTRDVKVPSSFANPEESIKWFKKITAYAVSSILYLRHFFAESAFTTVNFETHKLRVLTKKSGIKNALMIIENLEDCFKILEQNKLKSITMGIFEKVEEGFCQNAVEVVTFDYESATFHLNSQSNDGSDFQKEYSMAFKNLLKILRVMKPFPPGSYYVLFKLQHLDTFDPEKEEMRHFTPIEKSPFEDANFFIEEEAEKVNFAAGVVHSKFHKLSINFEAEMMNIDTNKLTNSSPEENTVVESNIENENPEKKVENSQGKRKRKVEAKSDAPKKRRTKAKTN